MKDPFCGSELQSAMRAKPASTEPAASHYLPLTAPSPPQTYDLSLNPTLSTPPLTLIRIKNVSKIVKACPLIVSWCWGVPHVIEKGTDRKTFKVVVL